MSIFGFGMAVFRLGCVFNLFPQEVEPKFVSKYILVAELLILVATIATNMSGDLYLKYQRLTTFQFHIHLHVPVIEIFSAYIHA